MSWYPLFLELEGRPCVVIGGGTVATRKVEALLRAGARVTVVAPEPSVEIARLAVDRRIELRTRPYRPGDLDGAVLAVAATDDDRVQRDVAAEARAAGTLLNVVDVPSLSSFIAPAVLERGDLTIAVSTGGAGPALAASVRDRVSAAIGPEYAAAVRLFGSVRRRLRSEGRSAGERREILKRLAASDLAERVRDGDLEGIDRLLEETVGRGTSLAELGVSLE